MSKSIFKVCSHVQKNTQNPNPIFKITIYYTKYTQNAKLHSKCWKVLENSKSFKKSNCLFLYLYMFHNSYFVIFGFLNFHRFYIYYIYTYRYQFQRIQFNSTIEFLNAVTATSAHWRGAGSNSGVSFPCWRIELNCQSANCHGDLYSQASIL